MIKLSIHFYFSDEIIDTTTILPRKLVIRPVSAHYISEDPIETHGIKNKKNAGKDIFLILHCLLGFSSLPQFMTLVQLEGWVGG